jgi:hypothetical protein
MFYFNFELSYSFVWATWSKWYSRKINVYISNAQLFLWYFTVQHVIAWYYGPCGVTTGWSDTSSAVVKCRVV